MDSNTPQDQTTINLPVAATIINALQEHGIDPILYGSLGLSVYLGAFKAFGDVDLLVPANWVNQDWDKLQQLLGDMGFSLVDAQEHEFKSDAGVSVAFAEDTVLTRDGILGSLDEVTATKVIDGCIVRTLTPEQFKQAYLFSVKDGYRKESRGKKDAEIIELLDEYLATEAK